MALLLADFPVEVGGLTVNRLCGSGLQAINSAAHAIAVGDGDVFIGGGVESMTRAPYVQLKAEGAWDRGPREMADTTLGWRFVNPRLAERHYPYSMGETAENVAERWGVSRERQDAFALESQQRAVAAIEAGRFDRPDRAGRGPAAEGRARSSSIATSTRAPTRASRRWPGCDRRSGPTAARSRPATAPASTTAPRRSCSSRPTARVRSASGRWRASSRRPWPASTRRSWASAPSRPRARRSSGPGIGVDDLDLDRAQRGVRLAVARLHRRARAGPGQGQRQRRRDRARPPARA